MPDQPTPPGSLPDDLLERCEALSPAALADLSEYADALAEYREQETERESTTEGDGPEAGPERPDDVPAGASVTVKEINDNRYRYWQWRDGDKIRSQYIGPAEE